MTDNKPQQQPAPNLPLFAVSANDKPKTVRTGLRAGGEMKVKV